MLVEKGGPCQTSSSLIFHLLSETQSLTEPSPRVLLAWLPAPVLGYKCVHPHLACICMLGLNPGLHACNFTHSASSQSLTGAAFTQSLQRGGSKHMAGGRLCSKQISTYHKITQALPSPEPSQSALGSLQIINQCTLVSTLITHSPANITAKPAAGFPGSLDPYGLS